MPIGDSCNSAQRLRPLWSWLLRLEGMVVLLLACSVQSVQAQYQFDLWNTDQGLPQNTVQDILQTRDGYLWCTTSDGLVRFDGVRFTVFNKANTKSIRSNRLTSLYESRDGSLWIGTEDGGIMRYHAHEFTSYSRQEGLQSDWVWDISEDADGRLLVLSQYGVVTWTQGRFIPYRPEEGFFERIYGWNQRFGGLSFFDADGLHVFDGRTFHLYSEVEGLSAQNLVSVIKDRHGALWVEAKDARLFRLKDSSLTSYAIKGRTGITALHQDRRGAVWIGMRQHGLSRLHGGVSTTYAEVKESVLAIYEDHEGTIWLGGTDGLRRVRQQVVNVYPEEDRLPSRNVYSIYEAHDGAVWFSTWRGGLSRLKDGRLTNYDRKDGLVSYLVTVVFEDREGNLWVGTNDYGLARFKDGRFTAYGTKEDFNSRSIVSIYQDRAGALWVGTGNGVTRIRDGTLTSYAVRDGLLPGKVQAIYEDRLGRLWLGTNSGLSCFVDGVFTNYTEREGLSGKSVRAIYEDSAGTLWIGTYDGGLNRFKDAKFTRYTTSEGLFNNGVFQIMEDARGYFWIGCNRGIYRVKRQELEDFAAGKRRFITSTAYGKRDGMLNAECNGGVQPSGIHARDGRLWFPTQDGIAVVNPAVLELNEIPPPVVIEDCLLDNRPVNFDAPVELSPGQSNLEIHYTGLSFISPEQVRFKYRLEGLDDDWIDAGTRRTVTYQYVPPGTYTFRVTAANRDGIWNAEGTSLRLIVRPPFWRTWWFMTLMFGALISGVVVVYRERATRLHRARAAQEDFSQQLIESQERERKRIAAELHDSLGQDLLVIRNRALFGALRAEQGISSQAQFEEITSSVTQAIETVREIAYDLRPHHLDRLGLTTAIRAMVETFGDTCEIEFTSEIEFIDGLFKPEAEIMLYRILQEAVGNIVRHSHATEAVVEARRSGRVLLVTVQDNGLGLKAKAAKTGTGHGGFGLVSIAERVRILGGTHIIRSTPGRGTTLIISIELPVAGKEVR